jgi:hypothetical protein
MTIDKARRLLGKEAENYSDEQVLAVLNNARVLALGCVRKIEMKMASDGTSYFTDKAYLEVK